MKHVFVNTQPGRAHSMRAHLNTTFKLKELITMKENTTEVKDLVVLNAKNEAVTTSLKVAAKFGKLHKDVLKAIKRLDCTADFSGRNFALATYVDDQGKPRKMYEMTRDGFTFLVMGFTGPTASKFKEEYIAAFNAMGAELQKRSQVPAFDPSSLTRLDILQMAVDSEKRALAAEDLVEKLETVTKKMALMRDLGILYYTRGGVNIPAQRHITAGHFVVKTSSRGPTPELRLRTETCNLFSRTTPGGVPPSRTPLPR